MQEKRKVAVAHAQEKYRHLRETGWNEGIVQDYLKDYVSEYTPLIRIQNLSKPGRLENINLEIYPGEILGLVGLGESGKSTLLQALVGYISCTGDIFVKKEGVFFPLKKNISYMKTLVGFSPQKNSFYPEFTVKENLVHFSLLYGFGQEKSMRNALELIASFHLQPYADTPAQHLAPGIKKLLDIVCALVHDPKILILDEPCADLDPSSQKKLWDIIRRLNEKGKTIVLSSHHTYEIENLCHRIGIMDKGKLVKTGKFEDLAGPFMHIYELLIKTKEGNYDLMAQGFENLGYAIRRLQEGIVIYTKTPEKTLQEAGSLINHYGDKILDIRLVKPSIKEFVEVITHHA